MGNPFDEAFAAPGKPYDDHEALTDALEPGEKVVWTGRPTIWALARRSLGKGLALGAACVAPWLFLLLAVGSRTEWRSVGPKAVVACVAGAAAGGLCVLIAASRARWTFYAITNRRALIFESWLLGGRRPDVFTSEILDRLQCKERGDGSGDLIFDIDQMLPWWPRVVGFLGVDHVREVEAPLLRTLQAEALSLRNLQADARATAPCLEALTGIWRMGFITRWFQGLFFCYFATVATIMLVLGVISLASLVFSLLIGRRHLDGTGLATLLVVGGLSIRRLRALHRHWFVVPFEITIDDDRTATFHNWFRTRVVPVSEITSIWVGGWTYPYFARGVLRHKQGAVYIYNIPDIGDFVDTAKALNPSIKVRMP